MEAAASFHNYTKTKPRWKFSCQHLPELHLGWWQGWQRGYLGKSVLFPSLPMPLIWHVTLFFLNVLSLYYYINAFPFVFISFALFSDFFPSFWLQKEADWVWWIIFQQGKETLGGWCTACVKKKRIELHSLDPAVLQGNGLYPEKNKTTQKPQPQTCFA